MQEKFSKIIIILKPLLYFITFYILIVLVIKVFTLMGEQVTVLQSTTKDTLFLVGLQYFIFLIIIAIIYFLGRSELDFFNFNDNWFETLGISFVPAFFAFLSGFVTTTLLVLIINYFPFSADVKDWIKVPNQGYIEIFKDLGTENGYRVFLWFLFIVVFTPVFEETLFRGFLFKFFNNIFQKYNLDIIFTSLIFALFHINSLSNVFYAFVVGLFLAYQRKKTNTINSSIWIHGIINFTGLIYGIILYKIG